jgi:heme/copper-type cytochrome/quinol oxidase subunit 3
MTITTTEHGDTHDAGDGHGEGAAHEGGHHETPEQRDRIERLGLWLFIGGDAVFLLLELFAWFYLRALNTGGMWRGAACTVKAPCTDGLGNPITHEVAKASPGYTVCIAVLVVVAALLIGTVERTAVKKRDSRSAMGGIAVLAFIVLLAAIVVQCLQFGALPFQTIDGSYASVFEFFMGSTLAHVAILAFITLGLWNRIRVGRYDDGRWYRLRIIRLFAVWIAVSVCVLALVMSLFAG